jgi:hypothetical protein
MIAPARSAHEPVGRHEPVILFLLTALGVVVALSIRWSASALVSLFRPGSIPLGVRLTLDTGLNHWGEALLGSAASLVAGVALGSIVGLSRHRWAPILAGMGAGLVAVLWWIGFAGAADVWGLLGLGTALLMIPAALVATSRAVRRQSS